MTDHHSNSSIERLEHQAVRVAEIAGVLAKYELSGWLSSIPAPHLREFLQKSQGAALKDLSREERIRLALTELGTTFIKVGQMMSTRADLFGPELASELGKLQSQTPPDAPDVVLATVEAELGKPAEEAFLEFDSVAFASASVAQVHRARLRTGELVAVKVQKAGIHEKVAADLSILTSLADLIEKHSEDLKVYQPVQFVSEFKKSILSELDFTRERRNLERFGQNFADDETVQFPRVYADYSSRKVLTMDLLEGVLASEVDELRDAGEDLDEFARRGATIFLDMIFRDSFYHADPHPGNLMLLPCGIVGVLDCGMVGRLDRGLHEDFETLIMAVSQNDAEVLTDALWKLSTAKPSVRRDALQADLAELLETATQSSIKEMNLSSLLDDLTSIIRKYRIGLRPGLTSLLRTLVLLEGTSQLLNPEFSLAELMCPYYEQILINRFMPSDWVPKLQRNYRQWSSLLQTLPRDINDTVQQVQAGKFLIRLEHRHLDTVVNRLVLGIIVSALLLGSSLLWSLKAPPLWDRISIFGAAGYVLSLILGFLLFRSIEKSGKVTPKD
jgi:ubiquinone biosynthesis protein